MKTKEELNALKEEVETVNKKLAELTEEEQRYIKEGFETDEELSLYDMLFKNDLSKEDIKKLKSVSKELLSKIKNKTEELNNWKER